jgi:diguanylate cyclase (GGDEF)-like protein/PAS domain S-box-containing protein
MTFLQQAGCSDNVVGLLSLKFRILLPTIAASLVVLFIGIYFIAHMENDHKDTAVLQEAQAMQSHFQLSLDIKAEVMAASLQFIAQNEELVDALRSGDRQRLLELAGPIYERLHRDHNITHFYFHNSHRINLLRVHKPQQYGDIIDRFTALGAEHTATLFSGIELGPLGTFTLRSVLPITQDEQLLGYIELGQEIDNLIQQLHRMSQIELLMFVDKRFLVQSEWESGMRMLKRPFSWDLFPRAVLLSQSLQEVSFEPLSHMSDAFAPYNASNTISIYQDITLQGHQYWAAVIPVRDAGRRPVATLVMLRDMTETIALSKKYLVQFTAIFAAIGSTILVLIYYILGRTEKELAIAGQRLLAESKAREDMQSHLFQQLQDEHLKLEESQDKLEKISASAQDAILCMDNDGNISFWNKAAEKIFGYSQEEALGVNLHTLIVPVRFHEAHRKIFPKFQKTGDGSAIGKTIELTAIRRDGSEIPVELSLAATRIGGKWNGIGVLRDISERKKAQQEIEHALNIQRVLDTILNISQPRLKLREVLLKSLDAVLSIPVYSLQNKGAIFVADEDDNTLRMVAERNLPEAVQLSCHQLPFGQCLCGKAALTHGIVFSSVPMEQHEVKYGDMQPHGHYCVPIVLEGRTLGVLNTYVSAGHVCDESEKRFLQTVADTLAVVIERKQNEERLQHMAHHDKLTGLPNRVLLYDRMEQALALARRNQQQFAVLFLDLDHFKEINDSLGHDMGDVLLKETAKRLLACVRAMDTVARMGGDEFTVIVTETKTPETAAHVAGNILKVLQEPFELNGTCYHISCSIGIALFPTHGLDRETLLKAADIAMYSAKEHRNGFSVFADGHSPVLM